MIRRFSPVALFVSLCFSSFGFAGEAKVAVYAVNAESGALRPAAGDLAPAKGQQIIASAMGPAGSKLVIVPFFAEAPMLRHAPVLVEQDANEEPVSFPAAESKSGVPFAPGDSSFDLYVVCFPKGSPDLPTVEKNVRLLEEAISKGNDDVVELASLQLKEQLMAAVRQSTGVTSSGGFGDLNLTIRTAPAGKAAVSRTGTDTGDGSKEPLSTTPESFSSLAEAWKHASVDLPIGLVSPGAKVFTFSSSTAP